MKVFIDTGGTYTRIGFAGKNTNSDLKKLTTFATDKSFSEWLAKISRIITDLKNQEEIELIIIGLPGTIDRENGCLIMAPNLPDFEGKAVEKMLKDKFDAKIFPVNDASLGGLGEACYGAGKKYKLVGYLTVGTGIGGALVDNKKLLTVAYNLEPGQMIFEQDTWENLASGTAFLKRYQQKAEDCREMEIWQKYIQRLGAGVVNLLVCWCPEILVIGGGISKTKMPLLPLLKEYVAKNLKAFPSPEIKFGDLGESAGLYGGLALAQE